MEIQRPTRYPSRGRAQVALPNYGVLSGHTLDISVGGVCIVVDDRIPQGMTCPIRFELTVNGKIHTITAMARAVYGVFSSGGFRVGFEFQEDEPQRTALIRALSNKGPQVGARASQPQAPPVSPDPSF